MILWIASFAFAGECLTPTNLATLNASIDRAEKAFMDLNEEAMRTEVVSLHSNLLPCIDTTIDEATAARVHRLMSIHLFALGEEEGAYRALAAAKGIAPDTGYPEGLLVADHPLVLKWDALEVERKTHKVPEPKEGFLAFDGETGRLRPKDVPSVAQRLDSSGTPTWTSYTDARAPLVRYDAIPRKRNALIGCAAAGAGVGIGAWAAALVSRQALVTGAKDMKKSAEELNGLRTQAGALQVVSFVGFGVGVGCGAGALMESMP